MPFCVIPLNFKYDWNVIKLVLMFCYVLFMIMFDFNTSLWPVFQARASSYDCDYYSHSFQIKLYYTLKWHSSVYHTCGCDTWLTLHKSVWYLIMLYMVCVCFVLLIHVVVQIVVTWVVILAFPWWLLILVSRSDCDSLLHVVIW